MTTVIVCGYGKIGQIKCDIWNSIGCAVIVYDNNESRVDKASIKGFGAINSIDSLKSKIPTAGKYILDISTSSGEHGTIVKLLLPRLIHKPSAIIIEKPLASTTPELNEIVRIIKDTNLYDRTFINENYYASVALNKLKTYVNKQGEVSVIKIIFSKDRSADELGGRFRDENLNGYGIELPHMLACIRCLGIRNYVVESNYLVVNNEHNDRNEGISITLKSGRTRILLKQSLGKLRLTSERGDRLCATNPTLPTRSVYIKTFNGDELMAIFDPVKHYPRYHSMLIEVPKNGVPKKEIIYDNHLKKAIKSVYEFVQNDMKSDILELMSLANSVISNGEIIKLRRTAKILKS